MDSVSFSPTQEPEDEAMTEAALIIHFQLFVIIANLWIVPIPRI